MPLFEFKCPTCGYEFEELIKQGEESNTSLKCKMCSDYAIKKMSTFSAVIVGGSTTETVDMSIGREAEKRWKNYNEKQQKRRGNAELKPLNLPKSEDGKYMPVMGLGSKEDKEKKQEYSSALQEHRKEREKKGQSQFSEIGAF